MPPVRWKKFFQVMAIVIQVAASTTDAQHMHQDSYSQTSDGWVPIVSHRRQQPGYEPAITHYANPSQNIDLVKANVVNLENTTPYLKKTSMYYKAPVKGSKTGIKTKQILKTRNGAYITSPGGHHAAHIPLTTSNQQPVNRQSPPQKKLYVAKKTLNVVQNKPKKPVRPQGPVVSAHSSKNEVFAAPPNSASFSIVKSLQPNVIHTRETQGVGVFSGVNQFGGTNHFPSSTNQQHVAHLDFVSNRFTLPPQNNVFEQSNANLFFAKQQPVQDEFSRNLVPPPISRIHHGSSNQNSIHVSTKSHDIPITAPSAGFDQFGSKFKGVNQIQAPSFQNPVRVKTNEQAIDVQVTKEQVKQFEIQSPFNTQNSFTGGFAGFSNSPRPLTYEVTEGTRFFESPDFQFRPQPNQAYFKLGNLPSITNLNPSAQNFNSARPGLVFQALPPSPASTARSPFSVSPLVDVGEPSFLPTPYKVDSAVVPTSQSLTDVSTVFAQVTQRNKFRGSQQAQKNPAFFEITDISTHFPVLGNVQDIGGEEGTEPPSSLSNENSELTNEITTHHEIEKETHMPITRPTPVRDPTKNRITHRRRRPSTTTTTEAPVVETYEPIPSQEEDSGSQPISEVEDTFRQTERPTRRRRPRPNPTRVKSGNEESDENARPQQRRPTEENVYRRPTSEENRLRGRHRFRPRGKYQTLNEDNQTPTRPRVRPSRPELTSYEEATEVSLEHNSVESQFGSYSDEKTAEHQDLEKLEGSRERTTEKPFIEEVHQIQNVRNKLVDNTRSTTTTTEESLPKEASTEFHLPENEIDHTTPSSILHEEYSTQTTTTTSTTTTTTAAPETTTTKVVRTRIRPNKFDNSNRPKFSVKDYRQKLDHLTSTTQAPATASERTTSQNNLRLRFPQRTRAKPALTTTPKVEEDSVTDQTTTTRSRFKPKGARFQTTTESETIVTEKTMKPINNRIWKSKSNIEITTTAAPKVSIKPNLFSARRRSQYPSLRTRIQNKNKKNETDVMASESFPGEGEIMVSTDSHDFISTTESALSKGATEEMIPTGSTDPTTEDILKDDFSQRISDLTSSFKDNFKSVSPASRRIPNFFTISTDNPTLPIEAFFSSLNQNSKAEEKTSDDT